MSVYCGFATRKQEHLYNTILCKLLELLSEKLIPVIKEQAAAGVMANQKVPIMANYCKGGVYFKVRVGIVQAPVSTVASGNASVLIGN